LFLVVDAKKPLLQQLRHVAPQTTPRTTNIMSSPAASTTTTTFLRMASRILLDEVVGSGMANETMFVDQDNIVPPASSPVIVMTDGPSHGNDDNDNSGNGESDSFLFWSVNAFLLLTMIVACLFCYCGGNKMTMQLVGLNADQRRQESDRAYQQQVQQRLEEQAARKVECPEKRKQKLLKSFQRHKVQMVRVVFVLVLALIVLLYICVYGTVLGRLKRRMEDRPTEYRASGINQDQ
jgi:hypothetical protein